MLNKIRQCVMFLYAIRRFVKHSLIVFRSNCFKDFSKGGLLRRKEPEKEAEGANENAEQEMQLLSLSSWVVRWHAAFTGCSRHR